MANRGTVERDGFELEWVREGSGIPLMVLGACRFYPRYFPQSLRDHFEIVFCDLRQWVPTPGGVRCQHHDAGHILPAHLVASAATL